jgi:hypothetical protein
MPVHCLSTRINYLEWYLPVVEVTVLRWCALLMCCVGNIDIGFDPRRKNLKKKKCGQVMCMCWCVDVLTTVLMCWCIDVLMCWCVDVMMRMCWCVDGYVNALMYWCAGVSMWWCACVDVSMCWWLCWCVVMMTVLVVDVLICRGGNIDVWCVEVLVCWCVDVLMCRCDDVHVLMC